jgi:hypothetical protein
VGIYVDDDIIASTQPEFINSIIAYLETTFKVVKNNMNYFVGSQVEHDISKGSIFVHQERYILDVLLCFNLQDANEISTLADTHIKLWKNNDPADPEV